MKENNGVYIILKAYETKDVEFAVKELVALAKHQKVKVEGPIPLPAKKRLYTVNRGVHIDKTSREQFFHTEYKRMLRIKATSAFIEAVSQMRMPSGVGVKIKMMSTVVRKGPKKTVNE
ncbi:30S ribosomal protein S10 [Alphaproteobacteria bacterium endosymbiont of Tiliacea citrago]|uniref:30S ribosomal protein S10 n=1 Tax=Alphaproteobacteria bacterium endosymbiont of Tiliacea citrago TaxID=3077944 RepID=UPI00313D77C9